MKLGGVTRALRTRTKIIAVSVSMAALVFGAGVGPSSAAEPHRAGVVSPQISDGQTFEYINKRSGHCISDPASSQGNSVGIIQYSCHGGAEQYWTIHFAGTYGGLKYWTLKNAASGKCLADPASSKADNVQLIQYDCDGGFEQEWAFYQNDDPNTGFVAMINYVSQKCASVAAASTTPGAPIIQWDCGSGGTGADEQRWTTSA